MRKYIFSLLSIVLLIAGCGREREADIATPEEISEKDFIIILPSIPKQFCYADKMANITDEIADEINATNPQLLSVDDTIDCSYYGFSQCIEADLGVGSNNKSQAMIECISDDLDQICMYLMGNEYRDMDGNTFDETCVQGYDSKVQ